MARQQDPPFLPVLAGDLNKYYAAVMATQSALAASARPHIAQGYSKRGIIAMQKQKTSQERTSRFFPQCI